jgi:hypothetical protein
MIWTWLVACGQPLDQPVEVVFDRTACAHCAMLVSDPSFSAQLATAEGDRYVFDDPACAFRYVVDHHPSIAGMWFHDQGSQDWLSWSAVAFVPAKGAPMDGGWAAVPAGTSGAVSFGAASSAVIGGGR